VSKRIATVRTDDLEEALDYLEGLVLILSAFHSGHEGLDQRPGLLAALQSMDSHGMNWEPLRYGPNMGWRFLATNVASLRERLLEGYTDAAL